MIKRLFIFFLLFSSFANAQLSDKQLKEMRDNAAKLDSSTAQLNESINNSMHVMDSINQVRSNEQMTRNLNSFMAGRREQERKEMKRMYWRLGFAALMLIVLIFGLLRKKKQKV